MDTAQELGKRSATGNKLVPSSACEAKDYYRDLSLASSDKWRNFLAGSTYLEGQRDVVSREILGISGSTIWLIGSTSILTKSPDPTSARA